MIAIRTLVVTCSIIFCQNVLGQVVPPPGVDCSNLDSPPPDPSCSVVFFEKVDRQLNDTYKKLLARLDNEGKTKLQASQRAWVAFRDADIALVVHHYGEGGSLGEAIAAYRAFQLTRQRVNELNDRLKDDAKW